MADESSSRGSRRRLYSLDVVRGFSMLFILYHQTPDHAQWEGLPFVDLLLPWFIFVVGVSVSLAVPKYSAEGVDRGQFYTRLLRRTFLLFALGVIYNGGVQNGLSEVRILGVLQRIALCYCFAAIIFFHFGTRAQIGWLLFLLFGYWALLALVPVPGFGAGDYSPAGNLTAYVDRVWLPGAKAFPEWGFDPEGLLSTIPAIATCLMGVLCGQVLSTNQSRQRKVYVLLGIGVGAVLLGFLWGQWFPIIKKIWTSSFALVTAGYCCIALAACYQVTDIWNIRKWAFPLVLFGVNPLFIYMADNIMNFRGLAYRLVGSHDPLGLVKVSLMLMLLYWLYKKKLFIRV
jgi:predicted acyltransferase